MGNAPHDFIDPSGNSVAPGRVLTYSEFEKKLESFGLNCLPKWTKKIIYSFFDPEMGPGIGPTVLKFNLNQRALIELAKEAARKDLTKEEAEIMLKWAAEYGVEGLDHSATRHWKGGPHIRIGPQRHIPVKK